MRLYSPNVVDQYYSRRSMIKSLGGTVENLLHREFVMSSIFIGVLVSQGEQTLVQYIDSLYDRRSTVSKF